jgi:alpha-glucosidase
MFCGVAVSALKPMPEVHELASPDGRLHVQVSERATWSASFDSKQIFRDCRLELDDAAHGGLLQGATLHRVQNSSHDGQVKVLFGKTVVARDRYRELRLSYENARNVKLDVVFRCFDDAIAFRYVLPKQRAMDWLVLADEATTFQIEGNPAIYTQHLENYQTSHEHNVSVSAYQNLRPDTLMDLPTTIAWAGGPYASITEANLRRYAGMSLVKTGGRLECKLTPGPGGTKVIRKLPVETPWRVVLVGDRPGALLESNVIFLLNDPAAIGNTSWIKPGKMTWPWWNGHLYTAKKNEPILSFSTIRKYIDFCAQNGIAFHSVVSYENDRPWYVQTIDGLFPGPGTDVTKVRPDLDLPAILAYAKKKGVRLWTWVHHGTLRGRVEEAFDAFEKMGWSGMMVDFFDHDDQDTVEFAEEILKAAARHKILIHFHGIWKPTGWERTYPNLMNHEGALNLEYLKWGDSCSPAHDLLMAFTRLIAGPMDYHLGGFRAVKRTEFKPQNVGPHVLGTRCHQLAMYVCWNNPNPMVADYPEAYFEQPGFDFLQAVPTYWDETRIMAAEIGKYLVTARRKGRSWFVGGLAAGPPQDLQIPLEFLGNARYTARIWKDAPETEVDPNRLKFEVSKVTGSDHMNVRLGTDGGFVTEFTPGPGANK